MKKLTLEQAIVVTGFTGFMACKFSDFHEEVEKRLGRPIWTHQFADPDLWDEVKAAFRDDFVEMCA